MATLVALADCGSNYIALAWSGGASVVPLRHSRDGYKFKCHHAPPCCLADAVKLKQQAPDGKVKERFTSKGLQELSFRIHLGRDLLPDSIRGNGCLLIQAGELLLPQINASSETRPPGDLPLAEQLQSLPGVGTLEMQPLLSRSPGSSSTPTDSSDIAALLRVALSMVADGKAQLLPRSPFLVDDSIGGEGRMSLQRVLDVVSYWLLFRDCAAC